MLRVLLGKPSVSATWYRNHFTRAAHLCHVAALQRGSRTSIAINNLVPTTTTAAAQIHTARAVHTMSSSEGEEFDFEEVDNASDSEGYAPEPVAKKGKAPAKPKSTKAAAAPKSKAAPKATTKAAPKKKILVDHNESESGASDVDMEDEPPKAGPSNAKSKTASEKYKKLSHLEHILQRPDTYIGSVEKNTQVMWTFDDESKRMVLREVTYVPGFYKIMDEILVNAADNKTNDPNMDTIKVNVDTEAKTISVYNNGKGIPIELHSKENIYIPELIFGHLLAGSNFDDDEKKLVGGRNGFGAKLANIYSHEFTLETADKNTKKKYKQTWTKNMTVCGAAKITANSKGEEYTRVTFKPDLARFGMETIDPDTASLLRKRVYDMAGVLKNCKVYLNDERLKIKNFKQYVEMHLESVAAEQADKSGGAAQAKPTVIYEQIHPRWEVAFAVSDGTFQHVSFANSIATTKGGTHVNYIADQIAKNLIAGITKKNKAATVKGPQVKGHMWVFVNAVIENPTFDSQTKEQLTLTASKFGSKPVITEEFMKKVQKTSIVDNILNWAKFKADQTMKKTDGHKRTRLTGIAKLDDANKAGTKEASKCTLILTEGDSAKALAISGLAVVGRDHWGVFPLRGKLLNVREARHDQIMKNEEITAIRQILGLQHGKNYTDKSSLRYGQLMIMADQDHDGSHIKGLIINFLDHFYPSLLKLNFLVEFVTPIVRVVKGKQRKDFFTVPEHEQWMEDTPDSHRWDPKYYKGLGTSNDADARDYFSHMEKHVIPFASKVEGDSELIDLAFSKKKADERKEWLRQFKPGTYLDHRLEEIPYSDFVNKELILFSMADNIRSIPSVADGFKPGQRKVLWGCFRRKLKKSIKVAQLVGYVSEHAAYHHGEVSLMATIVGLAQNFIGSNNLNLLTPDGQYGTRNQGGKDSAAPRYIYTMPENIARTIFHASDDNLLTPQREDNQVVEPEFYLPIVPMVLINGAEGIGTGWSTNIPSYNPADIVANIKRLMNGEELAPMQPWWRGFTGQVIQTSKNKYDVTGVARKIDDSTIEITELPIHMWTKSFKEQLESMLVSDKGEAPVKNYQEHHANEDIHFIIQMNPKEMAKVDEQGLIEYFKLKTKVHATNMICFDFEGKIKKYDSPEAILEDYYPQRLLFYQKRKDNLASVLRQELDKISNQARFIKLIVEGDLVVAKRKKAEIVSDLKKHKFTPIPVVKKARVLDENNEDAAQEAEQAEEEEETTGTTSDFDYLLKMPIYSMTREKIDKLLQQAAGKEEELVILLKRTPQEIWNEDLEKFMAEWEAMSLEHAKKLSDGKPKKGKGKQLRTRKSIGTVGRRGGADDSDDDFKPIKAAAAARKPASKVAGPSRPKKAAPAKAVKEESDDSDIEVMAKAAPAKKKPAPIPDSDEDEDAPPAKKPAAKKATAAADAPQKKAPAKKKAPEPMIIDSDSEAESETEKVVNKGKGKAAPKRKSDTLEDEEDDELAIPAPKKAKQSNVTDFFGKGQPAAAAKKPASRKVSDKTAAPVKAKAKRVISDDDDDDIDFDDIPKPPPRAVPGRSARAVTKKYVEVSDDEDEEASMFVDDE